MRQRTQLRASVFPYSRSYEEYDRQTRRKVHVALLVPIPLGGCHGPNHRVPNRGLKRGCYVEEARVCLQLFHQSDIIASRRLTISSSFDIVDPDVVVPPIAGKGARAWS
jgi:hypothetical protein